MRISDWSSDVCSSDLVSRQEQSGPRYTGPRPRRTAQEILRRYPQGDFAAVGGGGRGDRRQRSAHAQGLQELPGFPQDIEELVGLGRSGLHERPLTLMLRKETAPCLACKVSRAR